MLFSPIRSFLEGLQKEFLGIKAAYSSYQVVKPGLYTYPITRQDGSNKRLHLRINKEGEGILFVDVTDVIHLKGLAAEIVKMALDGVNQKSATAILRSKYYFDNGNDVLSIDRAYRIIHHLLQDVDGCQTCALAGYLDSVPLFSLNTDAPYKVDIALTYGCNNQCPHCYNEVNRLAMPSIPLSQWYRVIDKIVTLGIPHIILTGGEATLHPDFLEIVRYADQAGLIVGLNSNGRYLGHAPFMENAAKSGLNHVQITLGSCLKDVHDNIMGVESFDQTVRGIQTALSSGVHVITNTTLMRSNMGHIEQLVEFLYDLGIRTFAMNGMIYSGGGFDHPNAIHTGEFPALIAKVRDLAEMYGMRFMWYTPTDYCRLSPISLDVGAKKCNAGEYSICIEPNGDVLPCQSYYISAGNILNDDWAEIWNGDLFASFRDRENFPDKHGLPDKCFGCPDLLICGAGCRIEREAEAGVRVAEVAGGGCVGCTGYINPSEQTHALQPANFDLLEGSFVPFASQVSGSRRSSGKTIIAVDDVLTAQKNDQ